MLVFLLCHPQGCSKEQIGLALWPETSPEQLRNVFHVTLSRLRSALGAPSWILTEGTYRLNPERNWECDAVVFEREVESARLGKGEDSLAPLQGALGRCGGDFLEGESMGEWTFEWPDA